MKTAIAVALVAVTLLGVTPRQPAGHEEPERSQAAAVQAGARDREARLRWPKADQPLFPITDARKTLRWINAEAGTKVQGHGLRATFASIAEELVSSALLERMMNHSAAGDVTLGHYEAKSEAQLRAGWQARHSERGKARSSRAVGLANARPVARRAAPLYALSFFTPGWS